MNYKIGDEVICLQYGVICTVTGIDTYVGGEYRISVDIFDRYKEKYSQYINLPSNFTKVTKLHKVLK